MPPTYPVAASVRTLRPAMAEVVVFHHALGLTEAVRGFAETLR